MSEMGTRFAVIGCGHIGKRHIDVLSSGQTFELAAVCDIDATARASVKKQVPAFCNIEELLSSDINFDAATIATPNGLHEEHAIKVLRSGKHAVIEKPMSLSAASCQRIIEEAKKFEKQVFCILQIKFSPVALWLKQLVDKGLLGKLFLVQVNCFWNRDARYYKKGSWHGTRSLDGGTLYTQFSHYIDLLYWLFGDIQHIAGRLNTFRNADIAEIEDTGLVNFEFINGGMASFNFSTAVKDQNLESNLTIIAEHGTVKISGQYMNEIEYCSINGDEVPAMPVTADTNYHRAFFENVVYTLKQEHRSNSNAIEAMKVVGIIEQVYSSCRQ